GRIRRQQAERRRIDGHAVVPQVDAERLADPPRTGAQQAIVPRSATGPHAIEPVHWLDRTHEHAGPVPLLATDDVEAPVDAVRAIDVHPARRPEHRGIAPGRAAERVRCRVAAIVGLDLDEPSADANDGQDRPDEARRDEPGVFIESERVGRSGGHRARTIPDSGALRGRSAPAAYTCPRTTMPTDRRQPMTHPDYGRAFALWREAAGDAWQRYTHHPFVEGLRDGSLPREAFLHYLRQDYVFLIHFARAWALAAAKAETLEEMQAASATVHALVHVEMPLHVETCAGEGISRDELEATPERRENLAYTRYVLEAGYSDDFLDLTAALAPCVLGYGDFGLRLAS